MERPLPGRPNINASNRLLPGTDLMWNSLSQDFRFAYRGLSRAKAFTAAAILTLALGIAGTTGMFALIEGCCSGHFPCANRIGSSLPGKRCARPGRRDIRSETS